MTAVAKVAVIGMVAVLGVGAIGSIGPIGPIGAIAWAQDRVQGEASALSAEASITDYFAELETLGLIDVDTGTREALRVELERAETLLQQGASVEAAVALYAIVESPRFIVFEDFVEYQNAEYDLAVALILSGAYDSALIYLERALTRGPESMYFAPSHRRAVDVALELRAYDRVLDLLRGIDAEGWPEGGWPEAAAGEQAYLRARRAYVRGDVSTVEAELEQVSEDSRLYSAAVYLRGVLRTRQGRFREAAADMCEVATTARDENLAFIVDERYFTIKDLARLGLGRIAHEQGEFNDAYYHYFQIPDDSPELSAALFEAAWSMYQQRELDSASDLLDEFFANFPQAPQRAEARLLAGYIDLANCRFDDAMAHYQALTTELEPVVAELDRIRHAPALRERLFARAIARDRASAAPESPGSAADSAADSDADPNAGPASVGPTPSATDRALSYLQLDPKFKRLSQAVTGLTRARVDASLGVRDWGNLGRQVRDQDVGAITGVATIEEEDAADVNALLGDVNRLADALSKARAELRRGQGEGTLPRDVAEAEDARLQALGRQVAALQRRAQRAARAADAQLGQQVSGGLKPLIQGDIARARALEDASARLQERLSRAANQLAQEAIDRLYHDLRRVLDKAKLGRIDAVIGQKRDLDIEVQDLAAGRYPAELKGRLWEEGLIGDDEEFWPFEGEYWADEYEGWR